MKTLLKLMPHGQAFVTLHNDGRKVLTSYQTEAAELSVDGWLTVKCWCSPTTRKHVTAFMDEYVYGLTSREEQGTAKTGSYQTAKALFEGHMKLDTTTGEVVDL